MTANTLVPAKGFWVPTQSLIGTGTQLYMVAVNSYEDMPEDRPDVFWVLAESDSEAEYVAGEAYKDKIKQPEYVDGDEFFCHSEFVGNAIDQIEEALNPKYLHERIQIAITAELKRQKEAGKTFISDAEIDKLVDRVLQDELKK